MPSFDLTHVGDALLLRDAPQFVHEERMATTTLIAYLAEIDLRKLYAGAGYPSMQAYCVEGLHLSEDAASRRIQAARAARRFPALFEDLAKGRLHLTAVCLLAPHLTQENAADLIQAATRKGKREIEELLARRFGVAERLASVRLVPAVPLSAPARTNEHSGLTQANDLSALARTNEHSALAGMEPLPAVGSEVAAATERYFLQVTISKSTYDELRHAQALLGHSIPNGDVDQVLHRALKLLNRQIENRKFGARACQRVSRRSSKRARHIPAHVRRAVWERDGKRCTFVSASGHRCNASRFLEFDHVNPVARGGVATVDGIRLRCCTHNQFEAEQVFGATFMAQKREEARVTAAAARARVAESYAVDQGAPAEEAATKAQADAEAKDRIEDVLAGLRTLGCRGEGARRAAEFSETLENAPLEERMRAALGYLGKRMIQGRTVRVNGGVT